MREDVEEGEDLLSSVALEDAVKEPEQKPARKRASRSKAEKPAKEAKKEAKPEKAAAQEKAQEANSPKAEKPAKPAKDEKPPRAEKPVKAEKPAAPAAEAAQLSADKEAPEGRAFTFLTDVTRLMGVEVTINARRDEEGNVRVDMFGDTLGILIGRRGETLDALQYLTSLYVNKGGEDYVRVTLDTENYRAKREEALRRLANRMANRAIKTGRKVVMEPMNPYERRILHSALQQNDAVTTHSEGEEPNRHVVITLKQQN